MNNPFLPPVVSNGITLNYIPQNEGHQWFLLLRFARAIAEFEGFFKEGSIAQRNNNPGNLRPIGASTGFRQFETPVEGWERLIHQIKLNIGRGLDVRQFFLGKPGVYSGYAPLGDNPPDTMENYISHVKKQTGFAEGVPLITYFQDISPVSEYVPFYHRYPLP